MMIDWQTVWLNTKKQMMKKLFLMTVAALTVGLAANAQTEKGKMMLGGQIGFDHSKVKDADNSAYSFTIAPSIGYFVGNNVAVGLGLGYQYDENTSLASSIFDAASLNVFQVSPFARMYKGDGDFKFFGQLSVPMAWGEGKVNDESIGKIESYGVALSPGFTYFPTSKIGVELSVRGLYYESNVVKPEGASNNVTLNNFGLNADSFAPRIGVQFFF